MKLIQTVPAQNIYHQEVLLTSGDVKPATEQRIVNVYPEVRYQEIIGFGDGENDADMLAFAGIGVAMGNGVDAVKAVADYVTDDIDADGIANALKHFGLI